MSTTDRARRRAIRDLASRADIPYSVARRQLDRGLQPGEMLASHGRTIYPSTSDSHRSALVAARERWDLPTRLADTRRAARVPEGRAAHLVDRFPPTRGEPGSGVGLLYHGERRLDILVGAYSDAGEAPGDLVWTAELGEETAVDIACAALDRQARRLLGDDPADLGLDGARQILDALLIVGDDGHAAGTRVRHLPTGRPGTIVGAVWGPTGPPVRYRVVIGGRANFVDPDDIAVS
jgi:hypothetical protein